MAGRRTEQETDFLEKVKSYLAPNGFLPWFEPVTRNNGRLSAKLVNKIPPSKRTFAVGVPDEVRSTIIPSNIPAHLATAEYEIVYFESNPSPLLGILAYLPRNFDPSSLETVSTAATKAKILSWISSDVAAKEFVLRFISKEDMLNIMVLVSCPFVMVDEGKPDVRSAKNLEYYYKRMRDTETGNTWFNLVSRDTGTAKARKGTSAGYIPLNTFVVEVPTANNLQLVSAQMLGGPLFNNLTKGGKSATTRYEELLPTARDMIDGNTKDTFTLKALRAAGGVKAIGHRSRKDYPDEVTMKPAKVEIYKTAANADKSRFAKANFLSVLENHANHQFDRVYVEKVKAHVTLLQEAQKRKAKTSQSSMIEQKNTMLATNELLNGEMPSLGKKASKRV